MMHHESTATPHAAAAGCGPLKIGLIGFSDGRLRVHKTLESAIEQHMASITTALEHAGGFEVIRAPELVHSTPLAVQMARWMRARQAQAVVFAIPVFAFPNFSLACARVLEQPVLLSSPQNPGLPGLGGILAAHGAMAQVGLRSRKAWGDPLTDPAVHDELIAFCRGTGVIEQLKGNVYGLVGGRSIGMNTGVPDTAQWMRLFGVDVEHVDQLEVVRRGQLADADEVERGYQWLTSMVGRTCLTGKAAPDNVREQIRHYIALRSLVADFGMDFVGLKCHYDLSEYYVTGCLSAMLLNDPYDWNGPKPSTPMACEADSDGALTMQLLKLISGCPSMLQDVRAWDPENGVYACCNCGSQPSWYARRSERAEENMARVSLEPVIEKYGGGGAHFAYNCAPGPITLARLSRAQGRYRMFVARGEYAQFPEEKRAQTCAAWPHGYVRMNIDPQAFVQIFNANHIHVAPGDHLKALGVYCEWMGIEMDTVL